MVSYAKNSTKWIAVFFLPCLLLLGVLAVFGVYPFGEKTLLVADMSSEYIEYFAHLSRWSHEGGSILRSWSMGMGLNMLGLIAFYAASPFNLIILAIPMEYLTEAVFLITFLKIGLCGLTFHIYTYSSIKVDFIHRLLFSTAYALMGYNLFYSSNIMWLDGVAFLPLVLLGVERILREEKLGLFFLSLVYVFFSSYYIGYMIGIFSLLYFLFRFFSDLGEPRRFWRVFTRFLGSAVLAAGCCAVLLLPAFLNLKNGQSSLWDIPVSFRLNRSIVEMSAKLIPGVYDSLTDSGLPNLYFSVFGLLAALCYFLNRGISLREKLLAGGVIAILILSFSCEILDLAWHAFEDPTWFPARYSFVFSFFGLYLGLKCAENRKHLSSGALFAAFTILAILFIEAGIGKYAFPNHEAIVIGLFFLTAYALLFYAGLCGRRHMVWVVAGLLLCELWFNATGIITGIDKQFRYRNRQEYTSFRDTWLPVVESLPNDSRHPQRMELAAPRNANGALTFGFRSISHYSTTTDQNVNNLLQRLGYNTGTQNEIRFSPGSPVASGLLGIRHILSSAPLNGVYIPYEADDGRFINENPLAYPMAFYADQAEFSLEGDNPFILQNNWTRALWNKPSPDLFRPVDATETLFNAEIRKLDSGALLYSRQSRNRESYVNWTIDNPEENEIYVWFEPYGRRLPGVRISVNGKDHGRVLAYRNNAVMPLVADKAITLTAYLDVDSIAFSGLHLYSLNTEAATTLAEKSRQHQMTFLRFEDTHVDGVIEAPGNGYIATTFPSDEGWAITIDSRKVDPVAYCGVFIAIPVTKGHHTVSMRYSPPGFKAGLVISGISVLLALSFQHVCGKRSRD